MTESEMFEKSFQRPPNYFKLSAERQWDIDKGLGILDWSGDGLSEEDMKRFHNHYDAKKPKVKKEIFLIEEGWVDPMENHNADGYKPIGFVTTLKAAEKIVNEGGHYTPEDCWSVQYTPYNGVMPKFKYTKLPKL